MMPATCSRPATGAAGLKYADGAINFGGGALSTVGECDFFVAKYAASGRLAWSYLEGSLRYFARTIYPPRRMNSLKEELATGLGIEDDMHRVHSGVDAA